MDRGSELRHHFGNVCDNGEPATTADDYVDTDNVSRWQYLDLSVDVKWWLRIRSGDVFGISGFGNAKYCGLRDYFWFKYLALSHCRNLWSDSNKRER
jgi:hypothetical protein